MNPGEFEACAIVLQHFWLLGSKETDCCTDELTGRFKWGGRVVSEVMFENYMSYEGDGEMTGNDTALTAGGLESGFDAAKKMETPSPRLAELNNSGVKGVFDRLCPLQTNKNAEFSGSENNLSNSFKNEMGNKLQDLYVGTSDKPEHMPPVLSNQMTKIMNWAAWSDSSAGSTPQHATPQPRMCFTEEGNTSHSEVRKGGERLD